VAIARPSGLSNCKLSTFEDLVPLAALLALLHQLN